MSDSAAARDVRLLVLDVDGVLTDGRITIDDRGVESKSFNIQDGCGIRLWMKMSGEVAIITGRSGMAVRHRADELGVRHLFQGIRDKGRMFDQVVTDLGFDPQEVAAMGDDLPDLPMFRRAGYPIAVANAVAEIRSLAAFQTVRPGGQGAVREAIEHLLKAQGRWKDAVASYE